MAVWALSQLVDRSSFATARASYAEAEPDPDVRAEWRKG
jgi:hypothetical protein